MNDRRDQPGSDRACGGCRVTRCFGSIKLSHLGLLVLVFGLLLWARFLLVTGHPRTAIADPPAQAEHQHASAGATPTAAP
ncbi:MAG: hypothetical protein IT438_16585 [Phycisphaerales bacterium]|nr:hypothetical protein [Phycisphaerales bacterium]